MMKPTNEQLRDPKWWDENAPTWAKVIIGPCQNGHFWWFDQFSGEGKARHISSEEWRNVNTVQPHSWDVVARPTKPAAPEWNGEGYPPVGSKVKFATGFGEVALGPDANGVLIIKRENRGCSGEWVKVVGRSCKPLMFDADQNRDDLIAAIERLYERDGRSATITFDEIADTVIAAGWRKEKKDD